MTSSILPLDASRHRYHGWKHLAHYPFATGDAWVPLVLAELTSALPIYPLAFTSRPGGGYQLVALQGLYEGENLYLDAASGRWLGGYIPCHYREYPFGLHEVDTGENRTLMLCVDIDSGLYRESPNPALGEERFFDDTGKPSALLQNFIAILKMTFRHRELTNRAVDALAAAGLLESCELTVENQLPGRSKLQGLFRVREEALNTLDGQTLERLRNVHALTVAYAQMFSVSRLEILRQLSARCTHATVPTEAPSLSLLETLFGGSQDDTLIFN